MFANKKLGIGLGVLVNTEDNQSDFLIDISDLPIEKVIIALFENVYQKSASSKNTWGALQLFTTKKAPPGTNSTPSEDDIRARLKQRPYIECLGAVYFYIDFSKPTIDTTKYDETHQTTLKINSDILTAKECIQKLRAEEKKRLEPSQIINPLIKPEILATHLLKKVFSNREFTLSEEPLCITFNTPPTEKELQKFAATLQKAGLSVSIERPAQPLLNTLITVPASLRLDDPIETIVEKLKPIERNRCTLI